MGVFKKTKYDNNRLKVSFDLDEVLFVSPLTHKTEPALPFPLNIIFKERLRYGTPSLINELKRRGYEVWVYTSSYRTQRYIKCLFGLYGVRFTEIVNAQRHLEEVQRNRKEMLPQKLPNNYRISLHIDDEDVVVSYGKTYGFEVYQLNAHDDDWKEKILGRMEQIEAKIKKKH